MLENALQRKLCLRDRYAVLAGFNGPQHLADPVDPDGKNQEIDPVEKARDVPEYQPRLTADDVEAHRAEREPYKYRKQSLGDVVSAKPHKRRKC